MIVRVLERLYWHPHLMFFLPPTDPATWGANLPGSPIIGAKVGGRTERLLPKN